MPTLQDLDQGGGEDLTRAGRENSVMGNQLGKK